MQILNLEQGSDEWLKLRSRKITATDCAAIMGVSPWKTIDDVYNDKMDFKKTIPNKHMERGTQLEPIAREYFCNLYDAEFKPIVAISDQHPWQMASLDGWDPIKRIILEIKCPAKRTYLKIKKTNTIPEDYRFQCLHQLAVMDEADYAILGFYFEGESICFEIPRCLDAIESITNHEEYFYKEHICKFVPPSLALR